jgi:hypothetical protein
MTTTRSGSVLSRPAYGDAMKAWYDAAGALWEPWTKLWQPAKGCQCGADRPCHCDPCDCCTPSCDLLVHARAGEQRVVPLKLHNPTRRPLTVTVDVGAFTPCGESSGITVEARVVPSAAVELGPCETRTVELLLAVGGPQDVVVPKPKANQDTQSRVTPQLERCATLLADVRFGGCGSRAVRIGVVVLPAVCGGYEVECDCGCC